MTLQPQLHPTNRAASGASVAMQWGDHEFGPLLIKHVTLVTRHAEVSADAVAAASSSLRGGVGTLQRGDLVTWRRPPNHLLLTGGRYLLRHYSPLVQ